VTQRLEGQYAERSKTIDKLKTATKYNSTQELLEKYGGAPSKPKKPPSSTSTSTKSPRITQNQPLDRTSTGPPPPTANIGRMNQIPSQPSTPQPISKSTPSITRVPQVQAEFAPNAFSTPQYATGEDMNLNGHWYDRILDLLLGEDETSPKNRIALICQNCRLVNGQAPPGTKTLAELGKWKCFGCGEMNGEEDEATKVVQEMKALIDAEENDSSVEAAKKDGGELEGPADLGEEISAGNKIEDEANSESFGEADQLSKPETRKKKGSKKNP
jgi:endoplasmic reticulum junction formation protein lunapark